MNIIAYTYEADIHCIACTIKRFSDESNSKRNVARLVLAEVQKMNFTRYVDEHGVWDDPQFPTLDNEGNPIHPMFSTDEWQEFEEGFLAENPTQYLACGDCHTIIEEYTHEEEGG
jgi:hypothetical protein